MTARAPKLNRKLILEAPVTVPDGAGGFSVVWTSMGTIWAQIDPRTGRETAGIGAPLALAGYQIVVRAAPPGAPSRPLPEQRFREGLRLYSILAVTERDTDARFLVCYAQEEMVA